MMTVYSSDCECFIIIIAIKLLFIMCCMPAYNIFFVLIDTVPFVLSYDANLINGLFLFHIRMVGTKQIWQIHVNVAMLHNLFLIHNHAHIAIIIYAVCCGLQTKCHGF